jgi:hypothetical protein
MATRIISDTLIPLLVIIGFIAASLMFLTIRELICNTDCTHYNVHDYWQGQQSSPEPDLIYADVTVASKHKKKKKPQQRLAAAHDETHDLDVQYSAINHDLTIRKNKHATDNEESIYYNSKLLMLLLCDTVWHCVSSRNSKMNVPYL